MKLIIDIPNEVLKSRHYCRYFGVWSTKLTETIENGKPYDERPQGEWKVFYTRKKKKVFKCDKCMAVSIQGQTNFCSNCGAKMQKGGADMREK